MNPVRLVLVLSLALCAGSAGFAQDNKADNASMIVGTWTVGTNSPSFPVNSIIEFRREGKFTVTVQAKGKTTVRDGLYIVQDDTVTIIEKTQGLERQAFKIKKISATELQGEFIGSKSALELKKKEEEKKADNRTIVGTWTVATNSASLPLNSTIEFRTDRKFTLNILENGKNTVRDGTYVVNDDMVTLIEKKNGKSDRERFRIKKMSSTEVFAEFVGSGVALEMKRKEADIKKK